VLFYDELIAQQIEHFEWPELDETKASSLCYTSGTTGILKGFYTAIVLLFCIVTQPVYPIHLIFQRKIAFCLLFLCSMSTHGVRRMRGHGRVQYGATGANVRWSKFGSVD
jgi:hypothetical protein